MAQLPADRTKLAQAQSNLAPSITASSQKLKDALTEAYDTVDLLNQKADNHAAAPTLPHADKSVTRLKLGDKVVGAGQLDDATVGQSHHQDNGIPSRALPDNVILQRHMSDNSVGSAEIQTGAVQGKHVANSSINSQHMDANLVASSASLVTQAEFDKRGINVEKYSNLVINGDWTAAWQAAIDTRKPVKIPQGEYLITDSLRLYENTIIVGDSNSAITYSQALTRINFRPVLQKDLFVLNSVPTTYVQGIHIEGLAISGANGNYVLNLPFMLAATFKNIKQFGGFNYGILIDGYLDTKFERCSFQGVINNHIRVTKTNWITTTTTFEKCYFSQGNVGLIVENFATNSLTFFDCITESLNVLADIYNDNIVNFVSHYMEQIPKTNSGGTAILLGVNGDKTGLIAGNLNIIGGMFQGFGGTYDTIKFIDADYFKNITITSANMFRFEYVMGYTTNVDRVSMSNTYLNTINNVLTSTSDLTKFHAMGGNFNTVQLYSSAGEYVDTPNISTDIYLLAETVANTKKERVFLDSVDRRIKFKDRNNNLRRMSFLEGASAAATFGVKLQKGEVIYNNNIGLGQPVGWVSQRFSRDSAANLFDGRTTAGSPIITSAAAGNMFWDFAVNDYVTLTAGMPSTTQTYRIIAKAADGISITLDTNASATATGVFVQIPVHSLQPFGQMGYRTNAGTPSAVLTPNFIGENVLDTTNKQWYKSVGTANTDWKQTTV